MTQKTIWSHPHLIACNMCEGSLNNPMSQKDFTFVLFNISII